MSKDKLTDYDSVASSNLDVGGISVAEGMLPSGVNNAIREQMSHLADFAADTSGVDVLKLQDDTDTNSIKLQAPASVTADTTFTMPDGDGSADQVLKTDGSGQLGWADRHANPSLIINGAFQIWQRGTSATTVSGNDIFAADRFKGWANGGGTFTVEQSTDVPNNEFEFSAKLTNTATDSSVAAGDNYRWATDLEGYNVSHLAYGHSDAKAVTLSFWVKSSLAGTYCGALYSTTASRHYIYEYTISSANTWEKITITISSGDTSGSWNRTNGNGLRIYWGFGSGTTYQGTAGAWTAGEKWETSSQAAWIGSASATFYITGAKLEVGSTATDFVHSRSYGEELALCQRYYEEWGGEDAYQPFGYFEGTGTVGYSVLQFTEKRDAPTVTVSNVAHFQSTRAAVAFTAMVFSQPATTHVFCTISRSSNNWASGQIFSWRANNSTSARIYFNAEL